MNTKMEMGDQTRIFIASGNESEGPDPGQLQVQTPAKHDAEELGATVHTWSPKGKHT